jgi:hypothetical protein
MAIITAVKIYAAGPGVNKINTNWSKSNVEKNCHFNKISLN